MVHVAVEQEGASIATDSLDPADDVVALASPASHSGGKGHPLQGGFDPVGAQVVGDELGELGLLGRVAGNGDQLLGELDDLVVDHRAPEVRDRHPGSCNWILTHLYAVSVRRPSRTTTRPPSSTVLT